VAASSCREGASATDSDRSLFRTVAGSLVGAAVLVMLPQTLTVLHDYEHMVLGLMLMGFMIFLRQGIVPGLAAMLMRRPT